MPEPSEKGLLNKELISLAKKRAEADISLLESYAATNDKAKKGGHIAAADFNIPETNYNKKVEEIEGQARTLLGLAPDAPVKSDIMAAAYFQTYSEWQAKNPDILDKVNNTKALDDAFRRDYLYNAPAKNLSIPDGTDTPQQLIPALLANNPGMAVGDFHSSSAAAAFVYDNIKDFKDGKVNRAYLDINTDGFTELNNLSVSELKKRLEERTPEFIAEKRKSNAEHFGTTDSDDKTGDYLKLFITAKENGIALLNRDKLGAAREFEASLTPGSEHRLASTNYTWSEAIIADSANKDGKYVVFGGAAHFSDDDRTKGLIDERLGIPFINFDNRETGSKSPILKGNSPHGADFYLPGGNCYPDTKKISQVASLSESAEKFDTVLPDKAAELRNLAAKYKAEFLDGLKLQCDATPEHTDKKPTYIPTPQPSLPAQGQDRK